MRMEPLGMGLVSLKEEARELTCSLSAKCGYSEKLAVCYQKEGSHQNLTMLILDFLAFTTVRNEYLFEPPSL